MEGTEFEPSPLKAESWTWRSKEVVPTPTLTPPSGAPRALHPHPHPLRLRLGVLGHKGGCQAPRGRKMRPGNSSRHSGACGPRSSAGELPAQTVGLGLAPTATSTLGRAGLPPPLGREPRRTSPFFHLGGEAPHTPGSFSPWGPQFTVHQDLCCTLTLPSPFPGGDIGGPVPWNGRSRMKGKTFWPGEQGVPYLGAIRAA